MRGIGIPRQQFTPPPVHSLRFIVDYGSIRRKNGLTAAPPLMGKPPKGIAL